MNFGSSFNRRARVALALVIIALVAGAGIVGFKIGRGSDPIKLISGPGFIAFGPAQGTAYLSPDAGVSPPAYYSFYSSNVVWSTTPDQLNVGGHVCGLTDGKLHVRDLEVAEYQGSGTVLGVHC